METTFYFQRSISNNHVIGNLLGWVAPMKSNYGNVSRKIGDNWNICLYHIKKYISSLDRFGKVKQIHLPKRWPFGQLNSWTVIEYLLQTASGAAQCDKLQFDAQKLRML